jgi:hypothetical protein
MVKVRIRLLERGKGVARCLDIEGDAGFVLSRLPNHLEWTGLYGFRIGEAASR